MKNLIVSLAIAELVVMFCIFIIFKTSGYNELIYTTILILRIMPIAAYFCRDKNFYNNKIYIIVTTFLVAFSYINFFNYTVPPENKTLPWLYLEFIYITLNYFLFCILTPFLIKVIVSKRQ